MNVKVFLWHKAHFQTLYFMLVHTLGKCILKIQFLNMNEPNLLNLRKIHNETTLQPMKPWPANMWKVEKEEKLLGMWQQNLWLYHETPPVKEVGSSVVVGDIVPLSSSQSELCDFKFTW